MDTQADKQTNRSALEAIGMQRENTGPANTNGAMASETGRPASPRSGPSDLALQYMEALRARRRIEPPGGLRIFNPDETPEQREVRIRETLAGLAAMRALAASGTEEDGRIWDEVMKAVERSRSGLPDVDSDLPDS
jgi:hypothetical protein